MPLNQTCSAASLQMTSQLASWLPSLTRITSNESACSLRTAATLSTRTGRDSSELKTGTTTETFMFELPSGIPRLFGQCPGGKGRCRREDEASAHGCCQSPGNPIAWQRIERRQVGCAEGHSEMWRGYLPTEDPQVRRRASPGSLTAHRTCGARTPCRLVPRGVGNRIRLRGASAIQGIDRIWPAA